MRKVCVFDIKELENAIKAKYNLAELDIDKLFFWNKLEDIEAYYPIYFDEENEWDDKYIEIRKYVYDYLKEIVGPQEGYVLVHTYIF